MQVYIKPVNCANVQKGWTETDRQISILIMKGMYRDRTLLRNVQGRNITKECTGTEHYSGMYRDRIILRNVQGRNITKECTGTEHY